MLGSAISSLSSLPNSLTVPLLPAAEVDVTTSLKLTRTRNCHYGGWRYRISPEGCEGIFRIGLFGATGTAAFDKLEMKKVVMP